MSRFGFLQKCRGFMWMLIPEGTVKRGQRSRGIKALKVESESSSHCGLSLVWDPLRKGAERASDLSCRGKLGIYLVSNPVHTSLVEGCPWGVNPWHFWAALSVAGQAPRALEAGPEWGAVSALGTTHHR